jgi:hypothetical protein
MIQLGAGRGRESISASKRSDPKNKLVLLRGALAFGPEHRIGAIRLKRNLCDARDRTITCSGKISFAIPRTGRGQRCSRAWRACASSLAAGLLAMEMGVDEIFYWKVRVLGDGGLELVMQRCKLGIYHDDAVVTDHDEDVAALAFEHVSLVAEVGGLDLS